MIKTTKQLFMLILILQLIQIVLLLQIDEHKWDTNVNELMKRTLMIKLIDAETLFCK